MTALSVKILRKGKCVSTLVMVTTGGAFGSELVLGQVRELYGDSGRTLLAPLGYDNTFAILVRGADARAKTLHTIDDAARVTPGWRAGFSPGRAVRG